jgi:HEAT repeat protein
VSRAPNGPASEWPRIKAMQKAGDFSGLIAELANPTEWEGSITLTARERAIVELVKLRDIRAVQPIARLLNDKQPTVRTEAAMALGKLGDASAVTALVHALEDPADSVRMGAAKSLGKLGDRSAVPSLIARLQDKNSWVRMAAARSLAKMGDGRAIEALKRAVRDEGFRHPTIRLRLSKALLILRLRRAD